MRVFQLVDIFLLKMPLETFFVTAGVNKLIKIFQYRFCYPLKNSKARYVESLLLFSYLMNCSTWSVIFANTSASSSWLTYLKFWICHFVSLHFKYVCLLRKLGYLMSIFSKNYCFWGSLFYCPWHVFLFLYPWTFTAS